MLIVLIEASPIIKELSVKLGISEVNKTVSYVVKSCPKIEHLTFKVGKPEEMVFDQFVPDIIKYMTSLKHLHLKGLTLNHGNGEKLVRNCRSLISVRLDYRLYVKAEASFATLDKVFKFPNDYDPFYDEECWVYERIIVC